MGKRGTPLGSLGLKALLQLQAQNVDVSKELRALGKPELITFTDATQASHPALITPVGLPHNKYHVSPKEMRTIDGITFDSKLELSAYVILRDRKVKFTMQPVYELQPKFTDVVGENHRAVNYKADFLITDEAQNTYVVELKGMETGEYKIKRKLFLYKFKVPLYVFKTVSQLLEFLHEKGILKK